MAYSISRGRFINFVGFEIRPHEEGTQFKGPWVADVDPSYVSSLFHGWEKDVGELVQVRDTAPAPSHWKGTFRKPKKAHDDI